MNIFALFCHPFEVLGCILSYKLLLVFVNTLAVLKYFIGNFAFSLRCPVIQQPMLIFCLAFSHQGAWLCKPGAVCLGWQPGPEPRPSSSEVEQSAQGHQESLQLEADCQSKFSGCVMGQVRETIFGKSKVRADPQIGESWKSEAVSVMRRRSNIV